MTREEAHRILSNGLNNAPSEHEWCMAFEMAMHDMETINKIEELVQNLGIQEPVLTFRELILYKKLKEICGV